jgi:membrane protein insertase Oxa1/YidC/SpoIIIJ
LYWVTNNTLTIAQQLITDRFMFRNQVLVSAEAGQSGSPNA